MKDLHWNVTYNKKPGPDKVQEQSHSSVRAYLDRLSGLEIKYQKILKWDTQKMAQWRNDAF